MTPTHLAPRAKSLRPHSTRAEQAEYRTHQQKNTRGKKKTTAQQQHITPRNKRNKNSPLTAYWFRMRSNKATRGLSSAFLLFMNLYFPWISSSPTSFRNAVESGSISEAVKNPAGLALPSSTILALASAIGSTSSRIRACQSFQILSRPGGWGESKVKVRDRDRGRVEVQGRGIDVKSDVGERVNIRVNDRVLRACVRTMVSQTLLLNNKR